MPDSLVCDVNNPLCGPNGASYVYGPQKGASLEQVRVLDGWLANYAILVEEAAGRKMADTPGSGAAGGLGFALMAVGGNMVSGATWIGEVCGLRDAILDADWVITGEGSSDVQTLSGKVPIHVAKSARQSGKRTSLLSGSIDETATDALHPYFDLMVSVTAAAEATVAECIDHPTQTLSEAAAVLAEQLIHSG